MSEKVRKIVPTACAGAPTQLGERVPLSNAIPVTAIYSDDGKPIRADGCGYFVDGKCLATLGISLNDAPTCLYSPILQKTAIDDEATTSLSTSARPTNEALSTSAEPTAQSLIPIISAADADGYLILGPQMHTLQLDLDTLSTETERVERVKQAIRDTIQPYESALIAAGKPLNWSERRNKLKEQNYWLITSIHPIAISRDKSGERETQINKRLPNGRDNEPFTFTHAYDSSGILTGIKVRFAGSNMSIHFSQGELTSLSLILGDSKLSTEAALSLLSIHGQENSVLYRSISSIPATPAEGYVRSGKTEINVSFIERSIKITNYFSKEGKDGYTYSQDLAYSAQENKFVPKLGNSGLSVESFLQLTQNIFELLPFARIRP